MTRHYKTRPRHRELQQVYRDSNRAAHVCLTSAAHGPATDGVLCAACRATHRRSA
jgi:hypothetical protein